MKAKIKVEVYENVNQKHTQGHVFPKSEAVVISAENNMETYFQFPLIKIYAAGRVLMAADYLYHFKL